MATHGNARALTIRALSNREPFRRAGFGMTAITDRPATLGRLPEPHRTQYREQEMAGLITYTVLSYATPILWVLADGTIVCPSESYSATTSGHQGLARTYVGNDGMVAR